MVVGCKTLALDIGAMARPANLASAPTRKMLEKRGAVSG